MELFSKQDLIAKLKIIKEMGWIKSARPGNAGGVGNTLEDLLGIHENNLPIPNAAEWELKCQRRDTASLTTLFHLEPSPRAIKCVSRILLPLYGWVHAEAGGLYPLTELSFRQTISAATRTDRGFKVIVDEEERKILVSFDANNVNPRHAEWLETVERRVGLNELNPQPYWGFDDLYHKAGVKLPNMFYVRADRRIIDGEEFFLYSDVLILRGFDLEQFITALKTDALLVDFDARSGHNHGTKFRLRQDRLPELYASVEQVV